LSTKHARTGRILSIDEGAVLPWQTLMWSLMKDIAGTMGVRTDVPFRS
jgi:excinuclease ABC subunit A